MQGDGNKRWHGVLVVGMRIVLDAIGKDEPQVEADVTAVPVPTLSYAPTHVAQINRLGNDAIVRFGNLHTMKKQQ
jgi:hypothetical protein